MFAFSALYPCAVLFEPVVLDESEPEPVAVFWVPVVLAFRALKPCAVLSEPVVFEPKALLPVSYTHLTLPTIYSV